MANLTPTRVEVTPEIHAAQCAVIPEHRVDMVSVDGIVLLLGVDYTVRAGMIQWREMGLATHLEVGDTLVFHRPFPNLWGS